MGRLRAPVVLVGCVLAGCFFGCERPDTRPATTLLHSVPRRAGRIVLGADELVQGIPSRGEALVPSEVQQWLADDACHKPLNFTLPLGLHTAEQEIPPAHRDLLTLARVELGRQLFFDKRLSGTDSLACAGCHDPSQSYTAFVGNHPSLRDPAVNFNRLFSFEQFWDGHAKSLFDQPFTPISARDEMHSSPEKVVSKLAAIEGYRLQFDRIFGRLDYDAVCQALAAFECSLVTGPSAWDYDVVLRELSAKDERERSAEERALLAEARAGAEREPLSAAARRGAELFFSERARCATCHSGPNFTDEDYHRLGVEPVNDDPGRFAVTKQEADRGAFKTPTLRNVAATAPYMHNGRFQHLSDAVAWVLRGGEGPHSDLQPVDVTPEELDDLVAFLRALSSKVPQPEQGKLPR